MARTQDKILLSKSAPFLINFVVIWFDLLYQYQRLKPNKNDISLGSENAVRADENYPN